MSYLKNQKGAALVLTLMIIIVIMLFILTLLYQVTNTTRQVTKMEEQHDAQLVAEMGIAYVRATLDHYHQTGDQELEDYLTEKLQKVTSPVYVDGERSFQINIVIPDITASATPIEITYTSIGKSGEATEQVDDTIHITYESGGEK